MKHFKITCIKPQELLPFEVAVRVDKQMGYNGALVQTRGIFNEQTFNSFLVQILHNLVAKYGSETLTANGNQMFDNIKIFWQYQMRGDHPHFKVPMLFMDKDYWIGLSDLANSGILSFYGISVITLQNNQVLLHTSAFRFILNTERLNELLLHIRNPKTDTSIGLACTSTSIVYCPIIGLVMSNAQLRLKKILTMQ
jgi:hypothetical protein